MRRYDQWSGNEKGTPEDISRCVAEVSSDTGWHWIQCSRKRGHGPNGLYCKQHAKMVEAGRILDRAYKEASDGASPPAPVADAGGGADGD